MRRQTISESLIFGNRRRRRACPPATQSRWTSGVGRSGFLVITQASTSGSFQGSSRWPHFNGTTPQVVVDGIGVVVGTSGNRHVVGVGIGDLVGTALQIPLANRGENLKLRSRALTAASKRTWSLPLPVQPGRRRSRQLVSDLDKLLASSGRDRAERRGTCSRYGVGGDGLSQELTENSSCRSSTWQSRTPRSRGLLLGVQAGLLLAHIAADTKRHRDSFRPGATAHIRMYQRPPVEYARTTFPCSWLLPSPQQLG